MTKRIIGLVLALCLIVGLLPMIALAEDEAEITSTLTVTTGTNDAKSVMKDSANRSREAQKAGQAAPPVRVDKKPGRNDPCPCGSGKKYKACCGRNDG